MNIQKLLSVVIATLASLGTLLLAMGQSSPLAALGMWLAAMAALVVNDVKGWFRLRRNAASVLIVGVVVVYLPSCLRADGQARLFAIADMLICLQVVLLFQERDERVYWWLAVMSLVEVVVAAGFSRGVSFGVLLVVYMLLGLFALSLLTLYSDWTRFTNKKLDKPPAEFVPQFTSDVHGTKRSGLVLELFLRLALMGVGTVVLSFVVFVSVPRLGKSAYLVPEFGERQIVGFTDKITLGELGPVLESRDEVMQVRLKRKDGDPRMPPVESNLHA